MNSKLYNLTHKQNAAESRGLRCEYERNKKIDVYRKFLKQLSEANIKCIRKLAKLLTSQQPILEEDQTPLL